MVRVVLIIVTAIGFAPAALRAETPRHFEFVECLRSRGMADLAIDYLQKLAANPPPELAGRIALELAKTTVSLADVQDDDAMREEQLAGALGSFEKYLKTSPDPLAAADANMEIARLHIRRGQKPSLDQSTNDEGASLRLAFEAAQRHIRAAIGVLEAANTNEPDKQPIIKQRLAEAGYLDEWARFCYALSYPDRLSVRRSDEIERAKAGFEKLADLHAGDAYGWSAKVMVGRCFMELDARLEAQRVFESIAKEEGKVGIQAAMMSRAYHLQLTSFDTTIRNRSTDMIRGCEEWLSKYSAQTNSPEAQLVSLLLANALVQHAKSGVSETKDGVTTISPSARAILHRAQRLLNNVVESRTVHSESARTSRAECLALLSGERNAGVVTRQDTFEDCYFAAQVDLFSAYRAAGEDARSAHLRQAARAIERGLKFSTRADSSRDVLDAKVTLAYLHLAGGDPYSATVLGEYIGRHNPRSSRGAQAAAYAVTSLARIAADGRAKQEPPESVAADEKRLRNWAVFMQETWPRDPATDAARFQLGALELDAKQHLAAFELLMQVRDSFPGVAEARYRASIAARAIQSKEIDLSVADKAAIRKRAIQGLRQVRLPTNGSNADVVIGCYQAKLELGNHLLSSGESKETSDEIAELGKLLHSALPRLLGTGHVARKQLEAESEQLMIAGLVGQAYELAKVDQFAQICDLLKPHVIELSQSLRQNAPRELDQPWGQALVAARCDMAIMFIRAVVNADRSELMNGALEALRLASGNARSQGNVLRLLAAVHHDLERARGHADAVRQARLEAGIKYLLNGLVQTSALTSQETAILARAYSDVGQHTRATELLLSIRPPAGDDQQQINTYRIARLTLAREFRLQKDFNRAKATMREIIGAPQQKGWGFDNFEVRKEAIQLMEDEGNFNGAARMAAEMQNRLLSSTQEYTRKADQLKDRAGKSTEEIAQLVKELDELRPLRERFFDFYFLEIRSLARTTQKLEDDKQKAAFDRIAIRLVKLERQYPDVGGDTARRQFRDLIRTQPVLATSYLAEGGKQLTGGGTTNPKPATP